MDDNKGVSMSGRVTLQVLVCRLALGLALILSLAAPAGARADAPPPATEVAQQLSLTQAAAAGIVNLTPKGGISGDSVAVDLEGARVPGAPVTATVRIEFLGTQKDGTPWPASKAAEIAAAIEKRLSTSRSSDGTPFTVKVDAKVRAGSDPLVGGTPGYHQIFLDDRPRASDANITSGAPFGAAGEKSGNWGANEVATTWAHETGHLLGLPDRYSARKPDFVAPDGTRYKLPEYTGSGGDLKAMDAWWQTVLKKVAELEKAHGTGEVQPSIPAGSENDIMSGGNGRDNAKPLIRSDIDRLIANAGVHLHGSPGDVLLNKDQSQQNMVVGAAFDVYAPKGGKAHRDGLYAYCIDLHRHVPATTSGFDVLGPAAAQGGAYPQYLALQRVAEEIARRQLTTANLFGGPPGANGAIWAVTDGNEPSYDEDARSILAAAGVTFDQASFSASPHFNDPNSTGASTAAVTPTGVLPTVAADRTRPPVQGDPFTLAAPKLSYLALNPRRIRAGRRTALTLLSFEDGSATRLSAALWRRRGKTLQNAGFLGAVTIPSGPHRHVMLLPRLRAGSYTLVLAGSGTAVRKLDFTVVQPKPPKKRRHTGH
jgi:hypothetical protein